MSKRLCHLLAGLLVVAVTGVRPAAADPVGTQIFTVPTAETVARDAVRIGNTMLTLTQANIGLTDDLQLGLNTVWLVATGVDLKYRFLKTDNAQAAILVGGGVFMFDAYMNSLYARPVFSFMLDKARMTLGGSVNVLGNRVTTQSYDEAGTYILEQDSMKSTVQLNAFGALELPLNEHVKLLGEFQYFDDPKGTWGNATSFSTVTLGARFSRGPAAVDAGMFVPLTDGLLPAKLLGIPLLGFSYLIE